MFRENALGGTGGDAAKGIVVDPWGNVYLIGETYSTDFPVTSAIQPTYGGNPQDSFITKVNADGSALLYSTYLGGASYEEGWGIAIDTAGNVYVTGMTESTNFPTANPFQPSNAGSRDAFVAKISDRLVVNSTDDNDDSTCDTAHCSLREGINAANASPGTDTIAFDIPGTGPHTIQPTSVLPTITDPVIIDGTTEPDYAGTPIIELNGSLLTGPTPQLLNGLTISAGNSTVRGLVINNFTWAGIVLGAGGNNLVVGNYIGTSVNGTSAAGNRDGVYILESANNRIGGTTTATRNVISGNTDDGVNLEGSGATGNLIQGNYIGTTANGVGALGNAGDGIKISGTSSTNTVGGTNPGDGNLIAFNNLAGVYLEAGATSGNGILGNTIFSNGGLGIDLDFRGPNPNDNGDGDNGPNNTQNYPIVNQARALSNSVNITGDFFQTTANTTFRVEIYSNTACDPTQHGEGQMFLGATVVTTDSFGNGSFNVTFPVSLPPGQKISLTGTDPNNNTSEFSSCQDVQYLAANLGVSQTESADPVTVNTELTYTITVTNTGPDMASGVTLVDVLPANTTFVSATFGLDSCLQNAGLVTCSLGNMNNGAVVPVTVKVVPTVSGQITNQVSVGANEADPNTTNNISSINTTVNPLYTDTYTPSPTRTPTNTLTPTNTYTPSNTPTPLTPTPTITSTPLPAPPAYVPGPSPTPSDTPIPTDTLTPSPIPTATNAPFLVASPTATNTPIPPPPPMG